MPCFDIPKQIFCRKICPYKELVQLDVAAITAGPITTGIATDMQVRLNEQRFSREGADVSPVTSESADAPSSTASAC
jgi:hypothetical protein